MMSKLFFVLPALFFSAALSAQATEKQTPTDAFRGQTQYQIMMCSLKVKLFASKSTLGTATAEDDPAKCIKDGKAEVKKFYPAALKNVSKNPSATKLIKDYYAAWLTAFEAVPPRSDELRIDYERRQAASEAKYDEIWNRLEVEAGI
ncbi:hypothetical protein LK542_02755 [Massilia sp. IC2-477]|uniref:hypothetical protein n=1 Tax=Massilia sp. IC2-477 TaxID=2887198 RepID=UPI001D124CD5|nr:hypothetical protein [Massilia sp. IC2-477]MCC2954532.1 hypothetical protein [Massilia sp. IC2-477]